MTAAILDHHRVAALALDQRGDIGFTKVAPEDQEITLPVAELRAIGNEIRALADPAVQRDRAVTGFAGAAWAALTTAFRQMLIELQRIIFLAIDEAIDRLD